MVELSIGDVTSGLARPIAKEIDKRNMYQTLIGNHGHSSFDDATSGLGRPLAVEIPISP
jgi:hypothetical protein